MIYHLPSGVSKARFTPPQARLTTWTERTRDGLKKWPQAISTIACALTHGHGKDHMLARLDDTTRTLGVAGIAALGSLGVNQVAGSLPLWLGGASWLAGMAVPKHVINAAVWAKTGMYPGTKYMGSNGDIRLLFQDPNYMPLQVLPQDRQNAMMRRLGIQPDPNNADTIFKKKLKQIAVQTHTWWMLMAGLATPVLSALFCDFLEDKFKAGISQYRQSKAYHTYLKPALTYKNPEKITQGVEALVKATIGEGTEVTNLSRWWKQLPNDILKSLELDRLSQSQLLHTSPTQRLDIIAGHLQKRLDDVKAKAAFETVLNRQHISLNNVLSPLESTLQSETVRKALSRSSKAVFEQEVRLARQAAEGTLNNFRSLMQMPASTSKATLKQQMEKSILAAVEFFNSRGKVSTGMRLTGGPERYRSFISACSNQQYGQAFQQLGDSVKSFLEKSLNALALRRRWFRLFPGLVGGFIAISTLIYVTCFLGKDSDGERNA